MNDLINMQPFKFWVQKVLPLVYDDSLSYYELLCKVVNELNEVILKLDNTQDNFKELLGLYNKLVEFVNESFDNLNVQKEVNKKLDEMVLDGTFADVINEQLFTKLDIDVKSRVKKYASVDNMVADRYLVANERIAVVNEGNDFIDVTYYRTVDTFDESLQSVDDVNVIQLNNGKYAIKCVNNVTYSEPYGVRDSACAKSIIVNNPTGTTEIINLKNSGGASVYDTRDQAGVFLSVKGRKPSLSIATGQGNIVYGLDNVQLLQYSSDDFKKIKKDMIIDTLHSGTYYSGQVTSVDVENQIIYIEGNWCTHTKPAVRVTVPPKNNIGFVVDSCTTVWGVNGSVTLEENIPTKAGYVAEFDIYNNKSDGDAQGISICTGSKYHVYTALSCFKLWSESAGFDNFAVVKNCGNAIKDYSSFISLDKASVNKKDFLINSVVNYDFVNNFQLQNDGTQNKLLLKNYVVTDSSANATSYTESGQKLFILKRNNFIDFKVPSAVDKDGEIIAIVSMTNGTNNLTCDSPFLVMGIKKSKFELLGHKKCVFVAVDGKWVLVTNECNREITTLTLSTNLDAYGAQSCIINGTKVNIHIAFKCSSPLASGNAIVRLPSNRMYIPFSNKAYITNKGLITLSLYDSGVLVVTTPLLLDTELSTDIFAELR